MAMGKKRSRWGIGLAWGGTSAAYFAATALVHLSHPDVFRIAQVPNGVFYAVGMVLMLTGIVTYGVALRSLASAFRTGTLATYGPYRVVRHPLYAAWLWMIVPGVTLLFRSWLMLTVPVAMGVLLVVLIGREERRLESEFGRAYAAYKRRVPALFPRFWK